MDIFKIIILSFGSFIVLLILTKLMGNREMAQLSMFDYIKEILLTTCDSKNNLSIYKKMRILKILMICLNKFSPA